MHTPTTKNVISNLVSPKRDKAMITLTILPLKCINLIASNGFYSLSLSLSLSLNLLALWYIIKTWNTLRFILGQLPLLWFAL